MMLQRVNRTSIVHKHSCRHRQRLFVCSLLAGKAITTTMVYHYIQHKKYLVCLSYGLQCCPWHSQIPRRAVTGNGQNCRKLFCLLTLLVYFLHDAWQNCNLHFSSRIMSPDKTKAECIQGTFVHGCTCAWFLTTGCSDVSGSSVPKPSVPKCLK